MWFARDNGDDTNPVPVRETRRYSFIDPALAPLAGVIPESALRRLRHALTLVFGAEALIAMRDVARLDPAQATDVMRWAAATLITGAITQATAQHQPPSTSGEANRAPGPRPPRLARRPAGKSTAITAASGSGNLPQAACPSSCRTISDATQADS